MPFLGPIEDFPKQTSPDEQLLGIGSWAFCIQDYEKNYGLREPDPIDKKKCASYTSTRGHDQARYDTSGASSPHLSAGNLGSSYGHSFSHHLASNRISPIDSTDGLIIRAPTTADSDSSDVSTDDRMPASRSPMLERWVHEPLEQTPWHVLAAVARALGV